MAATIMVHQTEEFSVHTQAGGIIVLAADGPATGVSLFLDEYSLGKLEAAIDEFRKQGSPEPIGS